MFIVNDMIEAVEVDNIANNDFNVLEPSSGDGAFTCRILQLRLKKNIKKDTENVFETLLNCLSTIYSIELDKNCRVAIECAIKDNLVIVFGEVSSKGNVNLERVAKRVLRDIGYFDNFVVISKVSTQSYDVAKGVDKEGAGDQGIMNGYATNETNECLPLPYVIARDISKAMESIRKEKYMCTVRQMSSPS